MRTVHALQEGLPICCFTTGVPGTWPAGHVWVALQDWETAKARALPEELCGYCSRIAAGLPPVVQVPGLPEHTALIQDTALINLGGESPEWVRKLAETKEGRTELVKQLQERVLVEELAAYAHSAWAGWMKYMFGKMTTHTHGTAEGGYDNGMWLTQSLVERWTRQMETPYAGLPESEKESDRAEARKMLEIVNRKEKL